MIDYLSIGGEAERDRDAASSRRQRETRYRREERERRGLLEERERDELSSRWETETRSRREIIDWFCLIPSRRGWETTSTPTPIDSVDERSPLDSLDSTPDHRCGEERSREREKRSQRWMTKREVWPRLGGERAIKAWHVLSRDASSMPNLSDVFTLITYLSFIFNPKNTNSPPLLEIPIILLLEPEGNRGKIRNFFV